ncbi:D-alanyl-D-alanine carboxypeptidase [Nocardia otitidiscaviarum]|uniref:D-alanyl-D-alanine carboxypeptidase n=1 Tax=Nocardia otitidiscaviarum TaxID=1823 RepID=A0A379JJK8_9NOCA|nr:D-alanyl-D-alanine carboxypeptidase [Nocardia otitidiscaviarum]
MRMNKGEGGSRGAEGGRGVRRGAVLALLAGTAFGGVSTSVAHAHPEPAVPAATEETGTAPAGVADATVSPRDGVVATVWPSGAGGEPAAAGSFTPSDAAALLVFGGTRVTDFATHLVSAGAGQAPAQFVATTAGLDPLLAIAYDLAAAEAHAQGVPLSITSGYRSPGEQQAMWEDGIATYGSPEEARRWVLPPEESTHVTGQAVDVGPREGAAWLEANGNRWGLCRTFDNEWWHFELATLPGQPCPARLPDASAR